MSRGVWLGVGVLAGLSMFAAEARAATFQVNSTSDAYDGVCDAANCTLRDAVDVANKTPGADTIVLPMGSYGVVSKTCLNGSHLTCGHLLITDDVSIEGAGSLVTSVSVPDGKAASARLFKVEGNHLKLIKVHFSGLTLRRGGGSAVPGGAIFTSFATVKVSNCVFIDNAGTDGGAVYMGTSSAFAAERASFVGNRASGKGGAIYQHNGISSLVNVTFSENSAAAAGGAVVASEGARLEMNHVSMVLNAPDSLHSALTGTQGSIKIKNSLFSAAGNNCTGTLILAGQSVVNATYSRETGGSCGFGNTSFETSHNREQVAAAELAAQSRGGGTYDAALPFHAPGPAAVEACDPTGSVAADQNGRARPADGDADGKAVCDIGAIELPRPLNLQTPRIELRRLP